MRIEDLDRARSRAEMIAANLAELRWLGLDWDEGPDVGGPHAPYTQSGRFHLYTEALEHLQEQGKLFACYLSRKDLQEVASAPHGRAQSYGGQQRALNKRLQASKRADGKTPSLRFQVEPRTITFTDALMGEQVLDTERDVGDFIVRRADGEWAYQLAVVVDDIAMNITEVVRGNDLLESTGAQLLLYEALNTHPPRFVHLPLLRDTDGERMAKRKGSLTLTALREDSVRAERIVGLLAYTLGLLDEPREATATELLTAYDLRKLSHTPFTLEPPHLDWLYDRTS